MWRDRKKVQHNTTLTPAEMSWRAVDRVLDGANRTTGMAKLLATYSKSFRFIRKRDDTDTDYVSYFAQDIAMRMCDAHRDRTRDCAVPRKQIIDALHSLKTLNGFIADDCVRAEALLNKLTWTLAATGPMEQDLNKLLEEIDAAAQKEGGSHDD